MGLMLVCGVLVLAGLAAAVKWGDLQVEPPPDGPVAARYLWSFTVAAVAGLTAGLLVAGAGGRLAMRLLAATAGDAAQGRITEAEEVVGRVTTGGTIDFIISTALFFGLPTGLLYMVVRRWLPAGRVGALTYGGLLLLVAATRIDPMRKDNPDFDIVGPGWLALAVFTALTLVHALALAAVAGRYARALPLVTADVPLGTKLLRYAPLVLLVPIAPVLGLAALVGVVVVLASHIPVVAEGLRSRPAIVAGRLVLAVAALAALPGAASAFVDIAGRGP